MPQTRDKSNFDIDLDFGNVSEQEIVDMFEAEKIYSFVQKKN